jgi:hypothetical protein
MPHDFAHGTETIPLADSLAGTAEDLEYQQRCRTLWMIQRGESVDEIAEELGVTLEQATALADDMRPVATTKIFRPRNELQQPIDRDTYREPHAIARRINMRDHLRIVARSRRMA